MQPSSEKSPDFAEHLKALDALGTMVALFDGSGRCLHANAATESALGQPKRALRGQSLCDWFQERHEVTSQWQQVQDGRMQSCRLDLHLAQAPHQGVQLLMHRDGDPPCLWAEMSETDQFQRNERESRTLGQAAASRELVRNLAHEVRNPLGGIRGAAQLLGMELATHADAESKGWLDYTRVIMAEADRLQALMDSLLAPHRKPHVEARLNIHEVLERVRSLVLAEFAQGLSIVRNYDVSIPEFSADREQLIQAVLNIVRNAAQALAAKRQDHSARIELITRVLHQVTLGRQRHKLVLELRVEDNGPGVDPDLQDKIFFPLVTGRDDGTGLGLSLALAFVQQHRGTIECDSTPGKTVFKILLPLT